MIVKDISFQDPYKNIYYDEVLLFLAEAGQIGESLRFWESSSYFIVLGRVSREQDDIIFSNVNRDNIVITRRCSGGGTVLQGKGCLNYSFVLSKENNSSLCNIKSSYDFILDKVISAISQLGFKIKKMGLSDIVMEENEKKFSGNSQKRLKKFILHHGTILYNFDIQLVERYLYIPINVPEYRRNRSHSDFITNLPVNPKDIKKKIVSVFDIDKTEGLSNVEKNLINKYQR